MEEAGFLQRHPWLVYVFMLLAGSAGVGQFCMLFLTHRSAPIFSVAVSGFEGLDVPSSDPGAAAAPTFHVVLRVQNNDFLLRHCFTEESAVVELDGVPLARADRLVGFCVPGRTAVVVPFVASGGGLGLPDGVYKRVRGGGGVPSLTVQMWLDEDRLNPMLVNPMLVRCTVTLDGRPSVGCSRFLMLERGINLEP